LAPKNADGEGPRGQEWSTSWDTLQVRLHAAPTEVGGPQVEPISTQISWNVFHQPRLSSATSSCSRETSSSCLIFSWLLA